MKAREATCERCRHDQDKALLIMAARGRIVPPPHTCAPPARETP